MARAEASIADAGCKRKSQPQQNSGQFNMQKYAQKAV